LSQAIPLDPDQECLSLWAQARPDRTAWPAHPAPTLQAGAAHPKEEFFRFQALKEQDLLARFDQLMARMAEQNAAISEEEVAADVAAAQAELDNSQRFVSQSGRRSHFLARGRDNADGKACSMLDVTVS
jgi:polyphosphate kinase 2 (PPK2 family)